MRIGFSGSHRTGKSEICKAVAANSNVIYKKFPTIDTFNRLGVDMNNITSIEERIDVQYEILQDYFKFIDSLDGHETYITDRTPFDIIAYLYADIGSFYVKEYSPEIEERLIEMKQEAFYKAGTSFTHIIHTKPSGFYVDEPGKPRPSLLYQWHIDLLIEKFLETEYKAHHTIIGTEYFATKLATAYFILSDMGIDFGHEKNISRFNYLTSLANKSAEQLSV